MFPFARWSIRVTDGQRRERKKKSTSGARRIMRYQYPKFRGFCRVAPGRSGTVLCGGIPLATSGERVRAVQSSQNPGDAPGFGRAAVGETPRDSRIRGLSPNAFSSPRGPKRTVGRYVSFRRALALYALSSLARADLPHAGNTARTARRSVTESRLRVMHRRQWDESCTRGSTRCVCARATLNRDVSWGIVLFFFASLRGRVYSPIVTPSMSLILWELLLCVSMYDIVGGWTCAWWLSLGLWFGISKDLQFAIYVLLLHELYLSREPWWGMVKSHAYTCVDPLTIYFTFGMAVVSVSTVSLF